LGECHVVVAGITKLVTVTINSCNYKLNAATASTATVTVECEHAGESIEIHVYNSKTSETTTLCTYDIEPQGPIGGITLTNNGGSPSDVVAKGNVGTSVVNTIKSAICGQKANMNATSVGEGTARATSEGQSFVSASMS
jgi:hypothetical protein